MSKGTLTQGEVIALVNYRCLQILLALVALANLIVSFTKAVASAARLNEVFALESELADGRLEMGKEKEKAAKVRMEHVTSVIRAVRSRLLGMFIYSKCGRDHWNYRRNGLRKDNAG